MKYTVTLIEMYCYINQKCLNFSFEFFDVPNLVK